MNATTRYLVPSGHKRLAVTTDELQALLGCGRKSAVDVGFK